MGLELGLDLNLGFGFELGSGTWFGFGFGFWIWTRVWDLTCICDICGISDILAIPTPLERSRWGIVGHRGSRWSIGRH